MTKRTKRTTVLRAATGVSVALLALSGCSGSNDEGDSGSTTSAAATQTSEESTETSESESPQSDTQGGGGDFDKAEAESALLTTEELGDGFTQVPTEQITSTLEQMGGGLDQALEQMTIEPAQCEAAMKKSMSQMTSLAGQMDQVAMAIHTQGASAVSQSIAPESVTGSSDDIKAQMGACSDITMSIQGMTAKASIQPVELDLGDDALGMVTTIEVETGGQTISQKTAAAYVTGDDNVMSLSLNGDALATEATLKDLASKAQEKAEPVL